MQFDHPNMTVHASMVLVRWPSGVRVAEVSNGSFTKLMPSLPSKDFCKDQGPFVQN